MNKTKFTPGPWKIGAYESGRMAVDGANGEEVTGYIDIEDAHLIAAAPELYEALKELCRYAEDSDGCQYGTLSTKLVKDIANAALAKARGEA